MTETKSQDTADRREAARLLGLGLADLDAMLEGKGFPFAKGDDEDDRGDKDDDERDDDAPAADDDEPDEDDEDDEDGPPFGGKGEKKSATTTSATEKRKAVNAGKTIKDEDGDDAYPIRTIGDIASALKKAKAIKDPDRKKTVMAHIRKGAGKINAGHMVPKSDDADKGTGKGSGSGSGPPQFIKDKIKKKEAGVALDAREAAQLAEWIESKVMSPDPGATKLREYWAHGEGRAKWRPGTPGDFDRLRRAARKYIPAHMLNGWVANVHKLATGEWPGKNAHGGKSLGWGDDVEHTVIGPEELKAALTMADPDVTADSPALDDDAVSVALDAYEDMAGQLTADDEYEQALADQVQWDMLPDATLTRSDAEPERGSAHRSPAVGDEPDDFDPSELLDEMESSMT